MIKLNVPLKAIGMEIDTACKFFSVLFCSVSLSFTSHIIVSLLFAFYLKEASIIC